MATAWTGGIMLLRGGPLAPVAPMSASLIVPAQCSFVMVRVYRDFVAGPGEFAGVTTDPQAIAPAHRAIRAALAEDGGTLHDLSVTKHGRQYVVAIYYGPPGPSPASATGDLTRKPQAGLSDSMDGAIPIVIVSEYGRKLPGQV